MATFTGSSSADIITPGEVSPSVVTDGAQFPGSGRDTITGGLGDDTLAGGGGNDLIIGGDGNDFARLGSDNDRFAWSPGDDNDTVEGQDGIDTLDFSGSGVAENITISANGPRISFFRDIANVTMDLRGMETLLIHALGGADNITVNALAGTDAEGIFINLEGALGSGVGDGQVDTVVVHGTGSADRISITGVGTIAKVTGLPWFVRVNVLEATDTLLISGDGGADLINASSVIAGAHELQIDGGDGNDRITGSVNGDFVIGGDGGDHVRGGGGDDVALLGSGADFYAWKSGDGNDIIEGQDGADRLELNGASADESFDVAANGGRVRIAGSIDAILLDINDVESLSLRAGAGIDSLSIGDLTGTDIQNIDIDLIEKRGAGSADTVTVVGTGAADVIILSVSNGIVSVGGLPATTAIRNANAQDRLVVNGGIGADLIDASILPAVKMQLDFRGSDGNDVLLGSDGVDRFIWNPGDDNDTINGGGGGKDLLDFSGSAASEMVNILANGQQLNLLRDIAAVQITTNLVERVQFHAGGGSDTLAIGDLSASSARLISLDLAIVAGTGAGDGQADTISIQGRAIGDEISVSGSGSTIAIKGKPWEVKIAAREAGDVVQFFAGAGDDTVDLESLGAGPGIRVDGGLGNDVLMAGSADDQFLFSTALDANANVDIIRHFSVAHDLILLEDSIFVGVGAPGALAAGAFHIGSAATDAAHRIIYNESSGGLYFDSDGVGGNDAVRFAKLDRGLSLTEADFLIV
jgi:Ca2+-binding RTX toxin-like protein